MNEIVSLKNRHNIYVVLKIYEIQVSKNNHKMLRGVEVSYKIRKVVITHSSLTSFLPINDNQDNLNLTGSSILNLSSDSFKSNLDINTNKLDHPLQCEDLDANEIPQPSIYVPKAMNPYRYDKINEDRVNTVENYQGMFCS